MGTVVASAASNAGEVSMTVSAVETVRSLVFMVASCCYVLRSHYELNKMPKRKAEQWIRCFIVI
ncbi:hypothetical protein [Dickeya dadantii]|uniref:hypothetical protein n=1 Tax=Dickeya dadantii TaxID=204038 RepID=UPI0003A588E4|nr:hypothetical protein [Dickeya dadantii]